MHDYSLSKPTDINILSVTELNHQARRLLEINFHNIRVEGEISGLARPSSGHWYFTLKDERAQIRCAMFRNRNQLLRFKPAEGMLVQVRGRISLYENRGDYQLIIEHMEAAGSGALQKAFEALKEKLAGEGLFDSHRKHKLPAFPQHIAVITSPTGAAIRDILSVFKRRAPFIKLSVIPSAVQGEKATEQLITALQLAKKTNADAIIIGRGGGSTEDLWSFNEEQLARAIASHPIPVVSAVGHETDFTIADFVADYRAPTPSAAAEILSPDSNTLIEKASLLNRKLTILTLHTIERASERLRHISKRLRHPGDQLREYAQRLDDLDIRINQAIRFIIEVKKAHLQKLESSLQQLSPGGQIAQHKLLIRQQAKLLRSLMKQQLSGQQKKLQYISGQLHAVSPLSTLARGYSITQKSNKIVSSASELNPNDKVTLLLHKGSAECTVNNTNNNVLAATFTCNQTVDGE